MTVYDYIIVGAGSAGSILAHQLSAKGDRTVLVLEAGGSDLNPWIQMPIGYGKAYYDGRINWKYLSEPDPGLAGRQSYWPRGKVMGGSGSINAMVYVRGLPSDFEDWAAAGASGWGWQQVEPYFRKLEAWSGPPSLDRGVSGRLPVSDIRGDVHPLCDTYLEAAQELGLSVTHDYNGAVPEGAAIYQITTHGGRRASASRFYLRPALKRANLDLKLKAHVTGLIVDGERASGIRYRQAGRDHEAKARLSVILAAGAVNTPQILQLSGIGPGDLLQSHGIAVKHDLPAVGRNMQDHLGADFHFKSRVRTLNPDLRGWMGRFWVGLQYLLTARGPLSLSVNQAGGFVRTRPGLNAANQQLYFSPASYTKAPPGVRQMMMPDPFDGFLLGFSTCRPTSAGTIEIASKDPFQQPLIRPNYLSTDYDRSEAVGAMRYLRKLSKTAAFQRVIEDEISPGPDIARDEDILSFVQQKGGTIFHPSCTCRIGAGPLNSVVDPKLRVHGTDGLRVVDASVFPNITAGNINAPTMMAALKAADIIMEDHAG